MQNPIHTHLGFGKLKLTEGPTLNKGKVDLSCGKMKDEYGNILIIAAGKSTVEVLNTTLMSEWVKG